jgi:hypothetical protein
MHGEFEQWVFKGALRNRRRHRTQVEQISNLPPTYQSIAPLFRTVARSRNPAGFDSYEGVVTFQKWAQKGSSKKLLLASFVNMAARKFQI